PPFSTASSLLEPSEDKRDIIRPGGKLSLLPRHSAHMNDPLRSLGCRYLTASLENGREGSPHLPRLSRRGFMFLTASLGTSCSFGSSGKAEQDNPAANAPAGAAPVKTTANNAYRTPQVRGPVPRNPDLNLPSGYGR